MQLVKPLTLALVCAVLAQPLVHGEEKKKEETKKEAEKPADIPEPRVFVNHHKGIFNGQRIAFTATAGETYLQDEKGQPTASIFSIAYVKDGVEETGSRPVTFIFNGGPGSASLWLHMGAFGPKRVDVPSDARDDGAPPYRIIDNPMTILDVSDMVFIDPVGTGFSRALGETEPKSFWGVSEDAKSLAQFVRIWVTGNRRWNSPKYLAGESYGTMRAAAMANELEMGVITVSLNGIILISNFMDAVGNSFQSGNELGYITYLPSYTATAWYHKKLKRNGTLEELVDEARAFALGDYAQALLMGNRLDDRTRSRVRRRLAELTGLSEDYIERADLRVSYPRFQRELLRDEGKVVGRLDSRFVGEEVDDVGEVPTDDPSYYGIGGAYTVAINQVLQEDLGVEMDRDYLTLAPLFRQWNWKVGEQGAMAAMNPVNTAPYIGRAMRHNKDLRVLVASGYYDFATPFFDAENNFARNGVDKERMVFTYYEAGHMMYLHHPSLEKFLQDVRTFIGG